jgi:dTDP-4-dehydrorhamnose 3,5-epimerase
VRSREDETDLVIEPLRLEGTFEITAAPRRDERGYFMRSWDLRLFGEKGLAAAWVQENESFSRRRGIIRGLHFQRPPHAETKLVRVAVGAILDVFVDLRGNSKTYGQWDSVELSAENHKMVYVPKGFAHGYCALTEETLVLYKVDEYYAPDFEGGVRWDDPSLAITWPALDPLLSPRDRSLPSLDSLEPLL